MLLTSWNRSGMSTPISRAVIEYTRPLWLRNFLPQLLLSDPLRMFGDLTDLFKRHQTETAENIGYSCNMLREEMNEVFIMSANNPEDVRRELRSEELF